MQPSSGFSKFKRVSLQKEKGTVALQLQLRGVTDALADVTTNLTKNTNFGRTKHYIATSKCCQSLLFQPAGETCDSDNTLYQKMVLNILLSE